MKFSVLAAAAILFAGSTASWTAHAGGQPQLDQKTSAAATSGKSPDEAEASKMSVKRQTDAQKYQRPEQSKPAQHP